MAGTEAVARGTAVAPAGIGAVAEDIEVVMEDIAAEGRTVVELEATEQVCLRRVLSGISRLLQGSIWAARFSLTSLSPFSI